MLVGPFTALLTRLLLSAGRTSLDQMDALLDFVRLEREREFIMEIKGFLV